MRIYLMATCVNNKNLSFKTGRRMNKRTAALSVPFGLTVGTKSATKVI